MILTSFGVTLLVSGARTAHLLHGMETRWLDLMARFDRPEFDAPIAVVAIRDEDYLDPALFGGMSPLHPDALRRILVAVLAHEPAGVVLDVQIHPSPHESAERAASRLALFDVLHGASRSIGPPIVLVRELVAEEIEHAWSDTMQAAWNRLTTNDRLRWSDASIERPGGIVREVPRFHVAHGDDGPPLPTLLGAAIEAFHLTPRRPPSRWTTKEEHPNAPWRIRFTGLFNEEYGAITPHRIGVRALLSAPVVARQSSLLKDKIVLIGGTYHAGRDVQPTPVGDMAGVYVWAEAIASWIRHDALREPLASIAFALEFLVGVVAALLLLRFDPAIGLLLSLLVVGPLTVVFSLLTFGNRALFVNFLPSFVGVYLHYQIEIHILLRELRHESRRHRQRLLDRFTELLAARIRLLGLSRARRNEADRDI